MKSGWNGLLTAAHAWSLSLENVDPGLLRDRCLSWLTPEERARCEAFRTPRLRHEYLAARVLCRSTLSRYTGVDPRSWNFAQGLQGKPAIAGPAELLSLRFNLTHTDGLAVCLVSRAGEVGVDAEETSRDVDVAEVARHFLSDSAQALLASLPSDQRTARFFEHWVLKEAYCKGLGKGLGGAPERLTIELNERGEPAEVEGWQFGLYRPTSHHVAAVAVERRDGAGPVSIDWFVADDFVRP